MYIYSVPQIIMRTMLIHNNLIMVPFSQKKKEIVTPCRHGTSNVLHATEVRSMEQTLFASFHA